ncbi:hypothetical protein DIURU_003861 [Diutina rugosa]|uniref:protein-histidine N-methyltransferase n=1 Tax=Diutina rugosa TaxID=5481 RepID=A0A642UR98_DIURU|nr:uncharacterized protein DIURU_003861 [Diutina rugosa]KAA8900280.1 hypothetical protein DIURU_003861 [Diutina rugosa]
MGFSFGFTEEQLDSPVPQTNQSSQNPTQTLDAFPVDANNSPQCHSLADVVAKLQDVKVSFEKYTTAGGNSVFRRELFDVRHQIMAEDVDSPVRQLLISSNGDLEKNVYEGGFKSWECSYDVIDYISSQGLGQWSKLVDLGCGTALPSAFLLPHLLKSESSHTVYLSDFNYDVLELVTVPNLIINWYMTTDPQLERAEVILTKELLDQFLTALNQNQVNIELISGSWGSQFMEIVPEVDVVLTSETIYHEETLPLVAEMIGKWQPAVAVVAAKNIYFGVGGSVAEFVRYFKSISPMTVNELEVGSSQLKRSLVIIKRS